ncbi:putative F-box domain-containing protein [Helianthus anomalus]
MVWVLINSVVEIGVRFGNRFSGCVSLSSMADIDHELTQSGAMIGSNDDLLMEILRWLPVVSILRFKSVSKHWRSLLNHHHFCHLYGSTSLSPGLFVRDFYIRYDVENQTTPFRGLDFHPDPSRIKIVQSCNGLLLCCSDRGHKGARAYYVFNPITKKCTIIPPIIGGLDVVTSIRFMGLAFHQTDCVHYKIICIHREKEFEQRLQLQIYSSKTGKWKKTSNESFWVSYYSPFSGGVYWNRAFHWAPSYTRPNYLKLDNEKLLALPLPSPLPARVQSFGGYHDGVRPLYFGESRGHLHLVDAENYLHLNVYEMLSDHSGWFVKYQVELDDLEVAYPDITHVLQQESRPHYYKFEILDVVRGEDEEEVDETFMVIKVSKKIIRYSILDKSFKQLFDLTNTLHQSIGPWAVHRYTGSTTSF